MIEDILKNDVELLKNKRVFWLDANIDTFDDEDIDNRIITKGSILYFHERGKEVPGNPYGRFISIDPKIENSKGFELQGDL